MKYYISDLHFGHKNILRHSKRPFSSVEEMDETMIENWNKVVGIDDDVYIVGDICFKSGKDPDEYLARLNGRKHLVIGNHDGVILKNRELKKYFVEIRDVITVQDEDTKIVLCHYPMVEWNGYFRGVLHFYGHIHNNIENMAYALMKQISNAYNVGVDILGFTPRTKDQVIQLNNDFDRKVV